MITELTFPLFKSQKMVVSEKSVGQQEFERRLIRGDQRIFDVVQGLRKVVFVLALVLDDLNALCPEVICCFLLEGIQIADDCGRERGVFVFPHEL